MKHLLIIALLLLTGCGDAGPPSRDNDTTYIITVYSGGKVVENFESKHIYRYYEKPCVALKDVDAEVCGDFIIKAK